MQRPQAGSLGYRRPARGTAPGRTGRRLTGVRFRYVVRLTPADVGQRVVIRWRRPGGEVTDVLGTLEACDSRSFTIRTARGELVVVPRERALAGKVVPPAR
jgi:hypothetical protein